MKAGRKSKWLRILSCFLCFFICSTGFLIIHWSFAGTFIFMTPGLVLMAVSYRGSWEMKTIMAMIVVTVYSLSELFSFWILLEQNVENIFPGGVIGADLLCFFFLLLLERITVLMKGYSVSYLEWISIMLVPIGCFLVQIIILVFCKNRMMSLLTGTILIMIVFLTHLLLKRAQHAYEMQMEVKYLEEQKKSYEYQQILYKSSEDKIRALHHDMKNHFIVLKYLAEQGKIQRLQQYVEGLAGAVMETGRYVDTGNYVIDGLINAKLEELYDQDVQIKTNIIIPENLSIDEKDISSVLGNLLDNAIRAVKEVPDSRKKILELDMKEDRGKLEIKILNSYHGAIKSSGEFYETTKADKEWHGLGLKNVKRVVDTYAGYMESSYSKSLFLVELILFSKRK